MMREFWDLVGFVVTEPLKIGFKVVDETVELVDKVIDAPFKLFETQKDIEPCFGSPIFTEIGFGISGHSGIYIGKQRVIALNSKGGITENSLEEFTDHITTFNYEICVPYDNKHDWEIGFADAGARAIEKLGQSRNYHVLLDNCHQFTLGCLTGDFENSGNFLWMLKDEVQKKYGDRVVWRRWDWKK
ncbi:hypothetical protein [Bacillus sp. S56]|uniref:hypothetical protein n=1 Tax=Bacillus sp. S56 TaxID=1226987 RepID=UPI00190B6928|nr:hypothetical protein [Bacillus sp. S56]MBK0075557.1 hypothetical protein [Bacillus sp. S56]